MLRFGARVACRCDCWRTSAVIRGEDVDAAASSAATMTPEKHLSTSLTQSLTPVRFLESPKQKALPSDSSHAFCKARLDVIVSTLRDNRQKWLLAQKRGQSLCTSIEAIKTRSLEAAGRDADASLYPHELQLYCDKLAVVTSVFEDLTSNARESLKQLRALAQLPGAAGEVFYRSWRIGQFVEFSEKLVASYEQETKTKVHVTQELAHCQTRGELVRCATAWEYPQYVDDWITLLFSFLAEETTTARK